MAVQLDDLGAGLFGRKSRLVTAAWVGRQTGRFFQQEASRGVIGSCPSVSSTDVTQELGRLINLGMLTRAPSGEGDRRVYYEKVDSPLWQVISAALQAASQADLPGEAREQAPT